VYRVRQWMLVILVLTMTPRVYADPESPHEKINFNLPSGEFPKTILEFYHQSKIQVLFVANDALSQIHTNTVIGEFEPREALEQMLKGTGLTFKFATEYSVAIKQPQPAASSLLPPLSTGTAPARTTRSAVRQWIKTYLLPDTPEVVIAASRSPDSESTPGEPILTHSSTDFELAGVSSFPEYLQAVPQIFGGGPQEYVESGPLAATNASFASGLDLRGIGADKALIVWDGTRLAGSGTKAAFADFSQIPYVAIDRMDIVADGPSTRFGADAVSGVVYLTSKDISGAKTVAHFGDATSGSPNERELSQLLGTRWSTGSASLVLDYYERGSLAAADRPQATSNFTVWGAPSLNVVYGYPGNINVGANHWAVLATADGHPVLGPLGSENTYDQWTGRDILPWQQRFSALTHTSIELGAAQLWGRLWVSSRHATETAPGAYANLVVPSNNPGYMDPRGTGSPDLVDYSFGHVLGPVQFDDHVLSATLATGATIDVRGWKVSSSLALARENERQLDGGYYNYTAVTRALNATNPAQLFNPFADPAQINAQVVSSLRETASYESHSGVNAFDVTASHDVPGIPGGQGNVVAGAAYRRETLASLQSPIATGTGRQESARGVSAAYAQIVLPLVGERNRSPLADEFNVALGVRYEHYSDVGDAWSPKVSAAWTIVPKVTVRGTWGRSFRPPALTDTSEVGNISGIEMLPNGEHALLVTGGNASLHTESARTWTLGADYRLNDELVVNTTYFNVSSTGRVIQPIFSSSLVGFDGVLIPRPTFSQLNEVCAHSQFLEGSAATCEQSAVDVVVDDRLQNLERLWTAGLDLSAHYSADDWNIRVDTTYVLRYAESDANLGVVELLNTPNYPVRLRGRGSISRTFLRNITGTAALNYTSGYNETTPERHIGSWSTLDFRMAYTLGETWLGQGEFWVGVRNVADRRPPFVADSQTAAAWDSANGGNVVGRTVSAGMNWQW
jgi:iron complex outermembrane receptor protein